jgi:protein SCO1/2
MVLLAGLALVPVVGWATAPSPFQGLRVEPPRAIRAHDLVNHDGEAARFPAPQDHWQLAFFGYTHCPDVCPVTLHKAKMLLNQLGAQGGRLRVLFISIDTPRDRPEQVKQFVARHDARVVGLTGDAAAVQAVANEFGVMTRRFQGKTALAYTLEHSSFLYLIDPSGRVRMMYPMTVDPQAIAQDLARLW